MLAACHVAVILVSFFGFIENINISYFFDFKRLDHPDTACNHPGRRDKREQADNNQISKGHGRKIENQRRASRGLRQYRMDNGKTQRKNKNKSFHIPSKNKKAGLLP
jgi:hypothetical protein